MTSPTIPYRRLTDAEFAAMCEILGPMDFPNWDQFTKWSDRLRNPIIEVTKVIPAVEIMYSIKGDAIHMLAIRDEKYYAISPHLQDGITKQMLRELHDRWKPWEFGQEITAYYHSLSSMLFGLIAAILLYALHAKVPNAVSPWLALACVFYAGAAGLYVLTRLITGPARHYRQQAELGEILFLLQTDKTQEEKDADNERMLARMPSREAVMSSLGMNQPPTTPAPATA